MINFKHYDGNPFDLYRDAVSRKKGVDKNNLTEIEDKVNKSYKTYTEAFNHKNVHLLNKDESYSLVQKQALKGLYNSSSTVVKTIREWIDKNNKQTYLRICPYCTISRANTTEHIIPKNDYPEYAINALNLLPCCSECNSAKGENTKDDLGNPLFINFYYDQLPETQYLHVRLKFDKHNVIDFEYYIDNTENKIDEYKFNLIKSHFKRLGLLQKFYEKAIGEYTEIENGLKRNASRLGVTMCLEDLKENALEDAKEYGANHWKVILKLTLAESSEYAMYLEQQIVK